MKKIFLLLCLMASTASAQLVITSGGTISASDDYQTISGLASIDAVALSKTDHGSMGAGDETFTATTGYHRGTLDGNLTGILSGFAATGYSSINMWLTQDGTGGRTATFTCLQADGTTPGVVSNQPYVRLLIGEVTKIRAETFDGGATVSMSSDVIPVALQYVITGETALTTGTAKITRRSPWAFVVTGVRMSLKTASSSGLPTIDINEGASPTTILSTKLTCDVGATTSVGAGAAAVISDNQIADDAVLTFDVDVAGTDTVQPIVTIFGYR